MADRMTLEDFDGEVGCVHGHEDQVKLAIRDWFTTAIGAQTPLVRLRNYLDTARPIAGGWTLRKVRRALRAFVEDEPEN